MREALVVKTDILLISLLKKIIFTAFQYSLDTILRLGSILSTLKVGDITKIAVKLN
jgi:hypothetical protein